MIKGINRQMIEVTHTGSPYFERAYFVVRADCEQPAEETLQRLTGKLVQQAESYSALRRQRRLRRWQRIGWGLAAAAGGAAITVLIGTLI